MKIVYPRTHVVWHGGIFDFCENVATIPLGKKMYLLLCNRWKAANPTEPILWKDQSESSWSSTPGVLLVKEGILIWFFQIIVNSANVIDLWVYILLWEGSDHNVIAVPFNLPKTLLETTNTLSSCSSHAKHLQMSPCTPPCHSQASMGQMNAIWVLMWINRTEWIDGLQKPTTRLNYLNKIKNPKSYQVTGRLSWGLHQPMPLDDVGYPKNVKNTFFPESSRVSLGFYGMCRNQTHSPPSQNYSVSHPFTKVTMKSVLPWF